MSKNRYVFLLSVSVNDSDFSIDVSVDAFHQMTTPFFKEKVAFDVAKMINPDLGSTDSMTIKMMELRKNFNNDRLKGPLMITTEDDMTLSREEIEMYVKSLDPKTELSGFIKKASIR